MVCVPTAAVSVPPQLLTGAGALATSSPAGSAPGSVSFKPISVSAKLLVFWIVIVSKEADPATTGFGAKNLLTLAPGRLVKEAAAGWGLLAPLKVVTAPARISFVRLPLTVIVALKVSVQLVAAARLP